MGLLDMACHLPMIIYTRSRKTIYEQEIDLAIDFFFQFRFEILSSDRLCQPRFLSFHQLFSSFNINYLFFFPSTAIFNNSFFFLSLDLFSFLGLVYSVSFVPSAVVPSFLRSISVSFFECWTFL